MHRVYDYVDLEGVIAMSPVGLRPPLFLLTPSLKVIFRQWGGSRKNC